MTRGRVTQAKVYVFYYKRVNSFGNKKHLIPPDSLLQVRDFFLVLE